MNFIPDILIKLLGHFPSEKHDEIFDYFGVTLKEKKTLKLIIDFDDLLNSKNELVELFQKNIGKNYNVKILDKITETIINDLNEDKENFSKNTYSKIDSFLKRNSMNGKTFSELFTNYCIDESKDINFLDEEFDKNIGIQSDNFYKLMKKLKLGNTAIERKTRNKISEIINYISLVDKPNKEDSFSKVLSITYRDSINLTDIEKRNLLGIYLIFKRENYGNVNIEKNITISSISFMEENDHVIFYMLSLKRNDDICYTKGIVVRDSAHSLKLIGNKYNISNQSYDSITSIALSLDIVTLESERRYINGGIFDRDDDTGQPYHTWAHLSKIDDMEGLMSDIEDTYIYQHEIIKSFFIKFQKKDFLFENKEIYMLSKFIGGNYMGKVAKGTTFVDYIRRKLSLDGIPKGVDLL